MINQAVIRIAQILVLFALALSGTTKAEKYLVAFGSCYEQSNMNLPLWDSINKQNPDLFIFLGDNAYIDSSDPVKFAQGYEKLFSNPGIQQLKQNADIMAVWDDHDYGDNDGGKHFSAKQIAKEAFVKAFDYSELQAIPENQGIYHSRTIKLNGKVIRFLMLDTRWYRDDLLKNRLSEETREQFELGEYRPHLDESKTLLGKAQWQWLETQMSDPVDLNIIVSSIQFLAENTAWEIWMNFPHERNRLLNLINKFAAGKTIILSGDVHRGEISALPFNDWELFEITSSGLSADMYPGKPNIHRLGPAYSVHHFANLLIQVENDQLSVKAGIYNQAGEILGEQIIPVTN